MFYDVGSAMFWYRPIFMVELFLSEFLFTWRFPHKSKYWLRLLLTFVLCIGVSFAVPILGYNVVFVTLIFCFLLVVSVVSLKLLCYNTQWLTLIFYCVAAFAVQHIAFEVYNFIVLVANLNDGVPINVYGNTLGETYNVIIYYVQFAVYFVIYWVSYLLLGRLTITSEDSHFSFPKLTLSFFTVIISSVFNALVTYYGYTHIDTFYLSIIYLLIAACCAIVLCVQFEYLFIQKYKKELDVVKIMWSQEQRQYAMLKENIDYINIKCHDLKHQIRDIGRNRLVDESSIEEIQSTISIYDSSLKTGNEALDVLLMEKKLVCHNNKIRFTCIADGSALSFMKDTDIYSLFGNALDNAIYSLKGVEEEEKRVLELDIRRVGGGIVMRVQNYCPKKPIFVDGLPLTSHTDKNLHGFGMKSMRIIVENYGGDFKAEWENNFFIITATFVNVDDGNEKVRYI
jgi:hypothetical protein